MEMDEDTSLTKDGLAMDVTDMPLQPAERKRILPFDLVDFRRIKLSYRCATVCLGLLCAVLLVGTMGQFIYHASHRTSDNTQRNRLQSTHDALTAERKQLEVTLSHLTKEKDQLQQTCNTLNMSKNDLQTIYNSLENYKNKLHSEYIDLARGCLEIAKEYKNKMVKTAVQIRSMPCQTGWRKFGDSCYIVSTVKTNWTSSREACFAVGADLVVINSRGEQAFVNGLLESGQNVWIGLTDRLKEGTWMWVDGTPVTTTIWADDQPNSYNGNQDCGESVQRSSGVGDWNDEGCSAVQGFICEQ
ncbi:hypothetical protein EPR50_G00105060 [Perca flavescens]|uniref:C-type lectin domain-containing protein n=1 Tax=Perca flavescens TaxID=8167 RepID=A0A484CWK3_PERFV|nr:hypothetical protein EPR50_G00105060 [Perca flavescens]